MNDEPKEEPVKNTKDKMVYLNGKMFRCECGCNIFRNPTKDKTLYECNSCGGRYRGEV